MDEGAYIIRMHPGDIDVVCYEEDTMLEALEREGNPIPFGCRKGQCGSCKAKVLEGEAELSDQASPFALSEEEREDGWILLCSSIPLTDRITIQVELGEGTM